MRVVLVNLIRVKKMKLPIWFWYVLILMFIIFEWYTFAFNRGCNFLGPLNPTIHEYCVCNGLYYGPMYFNCFDCNKICATINNYTVNSI